MEEIIFLDSTENHVLVTSARFVANSKTYVMSNISSVAMIEVSPGYTIPVIILIIGVVVTMGAIIPGLIMMIIGAIWCMLLKPEYAVKINSNSGEANAFVSKDKDAAKLIVDAMNKAIIHRG